MALCTDPDPTTLSRLRLFQGTPPATLAHALEICRIDSVPAGTVLLRPGQVNKQVWVVLEGSVRIHLDSLASPPLVHLEAGECVGEMSIIEGRQASAFVVADSDSRLLAIDEEGLWSLVEESETFARNLLHILAGRLRADNQLIAEGLALQRKFEEYATVDALTGLHNRRWLDDVLGRLLLRCSVARRPLALLMLDVDRFKHYNDTYGHLAGDAALRTLAEVIRRNLRSGDVAARYGGEEFMVVLPDTDLEAAVLIAERLLEAVRAASVGSGEQVLPPITASIGLAAAAEHTSCESLIAAADAALYRAKSAGRNRASR
jgi:diguanylate cyclase (GGDEF)-like protein